MRTKVRSCYRVVPTPQPASIKIGDKYYLFGDDALQNPHLASYVLTSEDLVKAYPLFIRFFEERAGKTAEVISVPAEDYVRKLQGKKSIVSDLESLGYRIIPQGIAGTRYLRDAGVVEQEKVLVLDIGMRTVNSLILHGEKIKFCKSFYDEASVSVLLEYFRSAVYEEYPEIPNVRSMIEKIFEEGYLQIGFQRKSLQEQKQKAIRLYSERFSFFIAQQFSGVMIPFDEIVVFGGGTHYIDEKFVDTSLPLKIVKDEFVNAKGMLLEGDVVLDLGYGWAKFMTREEEVGEVKGVDRGTEN